jgi:hypothetical protein
MQVEVETVECEGNKEVNYKGIVSSHVEHNVPMHV